MPIQSPVSDSDSDSVVKFALQRWQTLDRGWKAGLFGIVIVLYHLVGAIP